MSSSEAFARFLLAVRSGRVLDAGEAYNEFVLAHDREVNEMKVNQTWNTPISPRGRRKALTLDAVEIRVAGVLGVPVGSLRSLPVYYAENDGAEVFLDPEYVRVQYPDGSGVSSTYYRDANGMDYAIRKAAYDAILMRRASPRLLDIDIDELNMDL